MVSKLEHLLSKSEQNEYIRSIGCSRRPDPKQEEEDSVAQVIHEKHPPKELDEEEEDEFEEYDLSEEDQAQLKAIERHKRMMTTRKNRKSTKRIN